MVNYKPQLHKYCIIVDQYVLFLYCEMVDAETRQLLVESRTKGEVQLSSTLSVSKHKPHTSRGQQHLHIYIKNKQLFSINIDGSAHDNSHGYIIPNKIYNKLKRVFPNYEIPDNKIIESVNAQNETFPFNEEISNISPAPRILDTTKPYKSIIKK